jgi:hypothetical protein
VLGPLAVFLGPVTGVITFGYGYWFGRRVLPTDSETATDGL